jgi:alpha-L-fucosidase
VAAIHLKICDSPHKHRNLPNMRVCNLTVTACVSHGALMRSVPLELDAYFNNQAFGTYPGESAFDALNQSFPAPGSHCTRNETFVSSSGIEYVAPGYRGASTPDNIICAGQTITLAKPEKFFALSVLHASDLRKKTVLGEMTFTYSDNSTWVASHLVLYPRGQHVPYEERFDFRKLC